MTFKAYYRTTLKALIFVCSILVITSLYWNYRRVQHLAPAAPDEIPHRTCLQTERLAMLQSYCNMHPEMQLAYPQDPRSNELPLRHILVDERRRILMAVLPKVGSSLWTQLFVIASSNGTRPRDIYLAHDQTYLAKFNLSYLSSYSLDKQLDFITSFFKVLLVRHPIERLISAYINKFVYGPLEGQTRNVVMYINKFMRGIDNQIEMKRREAPINLNVSIHEFVRVVTDKKSPYNFHWDTYTNLALPCNIRYDYIMKLDTMTQDSELLLSKMTGGKPELLQSHLTKIHSTKPQEKDITPPALIRSVGKDLGDLSKDELHNLVDFVRDDMEMFGYGFEVDQGDLKVTCGTSRGRCC